MGNRYQLDPPHRRRSQPRGALPLRPPQPGPGSRVLGVGYGDSQVALYVAAHGLCIVGIDLVLRHLENSWRNIEESGLPLGQVEVQYADCHHLEHIPEGSFDGMYCMDIPMHVTNAAVALAGFYHVLRPGGGLVLRESEQPETAKSVLANDRACMPANDVAAAGFYSRLMEDAGFVEIEKEDCTAHVRPLMRLLYWVALVPYYIVRVLRLEKHFVNGIASVRA